MARLTLILPISERDALFRLARQEARHPRSQAELIIRRELERLGLLANAVPAPFGQKTDAAPRNGGEDAPTD